ncbi:MAG TPA: hypothetical protein ENN75_02285, partial [candidate division Zixibacteria bacterium]|nr:hypothetical protein [candidate division Zixibacteria bacterium]
MDKYNLQIIPPHSGNVKRFSVTNKRLKWILGGIGTFILLNLLIFGASIFMWTRIGAESSAQEDMDIIAQQLEYNS